MVGGSLKGERLHSARVSRSTFASAKGWIGSRRPVEEIGAVTYVGPFQTLTDNASAVNFAECLTSP
jgi:hypothetical protein